MSYWLGKTTALFKSALVYFAHTPKKLSMAGENEVLSRVHVKFMNLKLVLTVPPWAYCAFP